jgi:hypothetical protein
MHKEKCTKFIEREVTPDPLRIFESRVSEINGSIIAFAYGTLEDGSPNVIGTGFNVENIIETNAGLFASCLHVMKEMARIRDLCDIQLKNEGLIDKKRRIAFFNKDRFEWAEVGPIRFSDKIKTGECDFVQTHDVCICRIPKLTLRPLSLSPDEYFMGSELGIVGFPNFEHLQRISVQPYVLRTILSSHMLYPFERDGNLIESERIALDCIAGQGFSGSPVFSVRDGKIVGMVDYLPTEMDFADIKLTEPKLIEGDVRIQYPAGISFAVPSKLIQKCLDYSLKMDWENPNEQTLTISSKSVE